MDTRRLNRDLAHAVDLFIMTKFQTCLDECKDVLTLAKMEAEQERNDVIIEAATALGIQALAEIDRWMDTTAFITNVYGSVDLCPPRIIQVCILLHAHVREYLPCHAMVQSWLRNPQNLALKQSGQVIRIYATHVLCPTGCQDMVKEIVDKCVSLTQTEKEVLLEQSLSKISLDEFESDRRMSIASLYEEQGSNHIISSSECGEYPETFSNKQDELRPLNENWLQDPVTWVQARALEGYQNVCQFIAEKSRILSNSHVRLILMGVMAVLALVHSQTGDIVSSLGRLVILWRTFLQKIFVMFKFKSK